MKYILPVTLLFLSSFGFCQKNDTTLDCNNLFKQTMEDMFALDVNVSPDQIIFNFQRILDLECGDLKIKDQSRYYLGTMLNLKRDFNRALFTLKTKKITSSESVFLGYFFLERGFSYVGLNKNRKAKKEFSKAVDLNPLNSTFLYNRGVSFFELGNYKKALIDLMKAESMGLDKFSMSKLIILSAFKEKKYGIVKNKLTHILESEYLDLDGLDQDLMHIQLLDKYFNSTLSNQEIELIRIQDIDDVNQLIRREFKRVKRKLRE